MWPKKNAYKVSVAWNGIKIVLDTEFPILKPAIMDILRGFPQLELSKTHDGILSVDQLTRDLAGRQQQISLLKDADAATRYSASRNEIERTTKLLAIQADTIAKQAPIVFVGTGDDANAIDFSLAAALAVAKNGNGETSHQVKALLQIAIESAEAEAQAAKEMLERAGQVQSAAPVAHVATVPGERLSAALAAFTAAPKQASSFKIAPAEIATVEPPEFSDPEPWKQKRMPFDPSKPFTAPEYVAHIEAAYPGFGTDGLPGVSFDRAKITRLQDYAIYFRLPESNVVSLRKSDLDGKDIWHVVRAFIEEFFPNDGVDMPANSLRVAAIMSALLDAEDLREEGASLRYIYNHLSVASDLLTQEVAEQQTTTPNKPLDNRPENRNPDAN